MCGMGFSQAVVPVSTPDWLLICSIGSPDTTERSGLQHANAGKERRKWERLPLPVPLFVRSADGRGGESIEFAAAWNISAGGALVALRRCPRLGSQVSLEVPGNPLVKAPAERGLARTLKAKIVRITHTAACHLAALKFSRPLLPGVGMALRPGWKRPSPE